MTAGTRRRPAVKLKASTAATASTDLRAVPPLLPPPLAMPATTESKIQPTVSSIIPDAKVIWPMSRRMTFISIITLAITGMAEMLMAVPMKRAKTRRWSGLAMNSSGSRYPRARPVAKGTMMPPAEMAAAPLPLRAMSFTSVSSPVSISSMITPSQEMTSRRWNWAAFGGKSPSKALFEIDPRMVGPSTKPAMSSPTTEGSFILTAISPRIRATSRSSPN